MKTMRKEGLLEALTNDRHFEEKDFRALATNWVATPIGRVFSKKERRSWRLSIGPNAPPLKALWQQGIMEGAEEGIPSRSQPWNPPSGE
jgi:hypothetical protein